MSQGRLYKDLKMPEFSLDLIQPSGILVFTIIILSIMVFHKAKFSVTNLGFNSYNSNHAQGIFIVIVIFHHMSQRLQDGGLASFLGYGYLSVGVFYLLSGYGLIKSLKKHSCYLNGFIIKKSLAILLPFILINALFTIILQINMSNVFTFTDFFYI